MKKCISFASALTLAVLASGCVTRVVYTPAPPPPPTPATVVVQSPPPPPAPPAPAGDARSAEAAAPQPAPAAAPQAAAPQPAEATAPPPAPPVAVQAPAPAAPPPGYVPDYYVWDGYEYVGVYGDQYVYWGGGAWIVCDPVIIARFHGWEHYHPYWRRDAYHYSYRGGYYRGGRGHWR